MTAYMCMRACMHKGNSDYNVRLDDHMQEVNGCSLMFNLFCLFSESSKDNYVLFQVASTIKECIIRDWSLLQPSDIESMRCFLLRYVTHNIV